MESVPKELKDKLVYDTLDKIWNKIDEEQKKEDLDLHFRLELCRAYAEDKQEMTFQQLSEQNTVFYSHSLRVVNNYKNKQILNKD